MIMSGELILEKLAKKERKYKNGKTGSQSIGNKIIEFGATIGGEHKLQELDQKAERKSINKNPEETWGFFFL